MVGGMIGCYGSEAMVGGHCRRSHGMGHGRGHGRTCKYLFI